MLKVISVLPPRTPVRKKKKEKEKKNSEYRAGSARDQVGWHAAARGDATNIVRFCSCLRIYVS